MSTMNRDKINILDKLKEIPKSIINGLNKRQAQETLGVSRKNWIINGDHQVNQRNVLPLSAVAYAANGTYNSTDRWKFEISNTTVTADVSTVTDGLRFEIVTGGGSSYFLVNQLIEDYTSLDGKTVTISADIKTNVEGVGFYGFGGGTGISSAACIPDGTRRRYSVTGVVDATTYYFVSIGLVGVGGSGLTLAAGDYIEFTNVKLEIGDTATPFEVEPYAEVLRKCQRYYYRITPDATAELYGVGFAASTSNINFLVHFKVPMRTRPLALEQSGVASDYTVAYRDTAVGCTSIPVVGYASTECAAVNFYTSAVFNIGESAMGRAGSTNGYLAWSAEL